MKEGFKLRQGVDKRGRYEQIVDRMYDDMADPRDDVYGNEEPPHTRHRWMDAPACVQDEDGRRTGWNYYTLDLPFPVLGRVLTSAAYHAAVTTNL